MTTQLEMKQAAELYPGYGELQTVLYMALAQAAVGKGKERHADGRSFQDQIICSITREVGAGYPRGQAIKKIIESKKLREIKGVNAEIAELLGAINYIAALIIVQMEDKENAHSH